MSNLAYRTATPPRRNEVWKRTLDIAGASFGLLILWPFFVPIAAAIAADSRGHVFFRQQRIGKGGKPFMIIKFRSMIGAAETTGPRLTSAGDPRVTRVGAFLRKHKIDELPQLINVFLGQMSLVGPRPEVPELLKHYTLAQIQTVTAMRPGMTDYASLVFSDESELLSRSAEPAAFYRDCLIPMKVALCARYIEDCSLRTDIQIILATLCSLAVGRKLRPWNRLLNEALRQPRLSDLLPQRSSGTDLIRSMKEQVR